MGTIHRDVIDNHLLSNRHEEQLITPFLNGFNINWARRRKAYNTWISTYFLEPSDVLKEQFGFHAEVMLAITDYPVMQSRTIQAVESCLNDEAARGRVDQTLFFIITPDENADAFFQKYTTNNAQCRIPIFFRRREVLARDKSWSVRSALSAQLFTRNFFDYTHPLETTDFFFGRTGILAEFVDAARKCENRGLFGLRRTGKTSVLKRVKRLAEQEGTTVLFYDCKLPSIRSARWTELLERITGDVLGANRMELPPQARSMHVSDRFAAAIRMVPKGGRICLVFDEIEWISPVCKLDLHWHADFIPFWQTIWTTQSEHRKLSFFVAGVNPTTIERDSWQEVQNPLFGTVRISYLAGFIEKELRTMLEVFGHRMGLQFTAEATAYLFERYGGHPLLTRMACSQVHRMIQAKGYKRPVKVSRAFLADTEAEREDEIAFYSRHVVSELKEFYPDEYAMLEMLVAGNIADFTELAAADEWTRHLRDYGLITLEPGRKPRIRIPVIQRFVVSEAARQQGWRVPRHVVPLERRPNWLRGRVQRILDDLRTLDKRIAKQKLPPLYGKTGIAEAERFFALAPVATRTEFESFINVCNRCFVEPLTMHRGKGAGDYFGQTVRAVYPELWEALERVRLYRHDTFHLELHESTDDRLQRFLQLDLGGKRPSQVEEIRFLLQQCVIDGLFTGIQCELQRLDLQAAASQAG